MPHGAGYRDPRKSSGHARRELFRRVLAEEDRCWICEVPVDKALRGQRVYDPGTGRRPLHPMSPTLDELKPVSKDGDPLSRQNIRLAHLACNQWRGDMSVEEVEILRAAGLIGCDHPRAALAMLRSRAAQPARPQASRDWTR